DRNRSEIRSAANLETAKSMVDDFVPDECPSTVPTPILLEMYREYNLVRFLRTVYAIPLSLGPTDLTNENERTNSRILSSRTVDEVKLMVDQAQTTHFRSSEDVPSDKLAQIERLYELLLSEYRLRIEN